MKNKIEHIYVKELFYSKNPKLARFIPGFIYNWLKKLICQDEINDFVDKYGDKFGLDFSDGIIEYLDLNFNVEGKENIPKDNKKYIFASNHPLGGPDGIILISMLGRYFDNIKFPVNDILTNLRNLNNIFIPINKHGVMSKEAAKNVDQAFQSDAQIITFPAGMVSRKYNGKVEDPEWQKSFINKAVKTQRDIVPIFVSGQNSKLFYRIFKFRTFFGIKVNFEMLLLPKETFGHKGKTFDITIGKPIPWQTFDKSKRANEWASYIKEIVYKL